MDITKEYVNSLTEKQDVRDLADKLEITYSGNTGIDTLKQKILDTLPSDEAPEEPSQEEQARAAQEAEAKEADEARERAEKEAELIREAEEEAAKEVAEAAERAEAEAIQVAPKLAKGKKLTNRDLLAMDAKFEEDPLIRRRIIRAKALRLRRVKIQNLDPSEASVPGNVITVYSKYTGKVSKYIANSNEEPYHIQQILLDHLQAKKFVLRKEIPGGRHGIKKYKDVLVRKYNIEILDQLTPDELKALGQKQVATQAIDD